MLELTDCEKKYGSKLVLRIPSLKLSKGIYCLQGMNGSGKTTFLRMIAGMIPFHGDIFQDKISLRHNAVAYRSMVSFAEAEPLYPAFITGFELVEFYQEIRRTTNDEIKWLIDLFQMNTYLSALIGSYSSGMTKKLSLLLAFIGHPSLILLDEPIATLDSDAVQRLPEIIRRYHQEWNCHFIFSSHQPVGKDDFSLDGKIVIANQMVQISA